MVQDIKITPSGAGDKIPQMLFTGSGATAPNMELNVRPDSRLSYESTDGEVFSISPNLQSGVIFAVKDISGLDQISINASGDTYLAPYYGNVRVGATGVIHEDYALDVQGKGLRVGASGTVLTRASAPAVTTDTLYNVGGSLYFDGSTVGGGSAAGAIHQIQYNDGSGFAGDSQFLFSKANAAFTNDRVMVVSGVIIANSGDANYTNPISIGSGAYIGYGATTPASQAADCIVIGTKARSGKGSRSVVIGAHAYDQSTHTTGENVVIGDGANVHTDAYRSISIGNAATTTGFMNITIGQNAQLIQGQDECIAIGASAGRNGESAATHSICLGNETTSKGHCGIAIGNDAQTYAYMGIGIGRASRAGTSASLNSGTGSVAIGDATYAGSHAVALGFQAKAPAGGFVVASGSALTDVLLSGVMKDPLTMPNGQQFIQMATAAQTSDLTQWQNSAGTNVASMTPSGILNVYDIRTSGEAVCIGDGAVNSYAASSNSVTIGKNAESTAIYDVAIGVNAKVDYSSTYGGVAIGSSANALQSRTVAIGNNSKATTTRSVAVGGKAEAEGHGAISIGFDTESKYGSSIAVGAEAKANADVALSIGHHAEASSSSYGAIALGAYTDAIGERSVAIGCEAQAHGTSWVIASGDTSAEVGISGVFGSYTAIPNDQKLAVGGNVPTYTVDALGHGATVRGSGVVVGNSGIVLANTSAPAVTANTLYNNGGTLSWAGSPVGGSSTAPASGSIYEVQYNGDGTNLGADSDFTWNPSTNVMSVNGHISASTKSFLINHPTKPDKKLQYACLEGPENGVYVRGHTNDNLIDLPDYWTALVDPESITVQLTAKDAPQPFLYVSGVLNNQVHLISDREISAYYTVSATRKDVDPLLVEPDNYQR